MTLDWEKIEEENKERNKKYKEYAPEGTYTTKLESVELVTAKTGNTGIRFNLKETDEYKFPKYGASFYNTDKHNWRRYHMKEVFVAVGASEEQARKAVEACEEKKDIIEAYVDMFTKFLPKQKAFEVVVFKKTADDKYNTWDFKADGARLEYPEVVPTDIPDDDEITMDDIPF